MKASIEKFIDLLQSYLDDKIGTEEFTEDYERLFKSGETPPDEKTQAVVTSYLNKEITREEFRREFKKLNPDMMDESLFSILEDLYEDIDAYSPNWTPEDFAEMPYLLDEQGLRKEVAEALRQLNEYHSSYHE